MSLFIDKSRSPKDNQGIIDIGKNCTLCHQLDFLPFHCEFCNLTYCQIHRTLEKHNCVGKSKFTDGFRAPTHTYTADLPPAKSLFPDREADKKRIDQRLTLPKPTNILEKLFRVGDVAVKTPNAFQKFTKFLKSQREKKSTSVLTKVFKPSKAVDLSLLRRTAKGDAKITPADRIYVWTLFVNGEESEELAKINIEKERKAMFISKNWPVGRALDSIADQLHIRNYNNSTRESKERLNIFKLGDEPVLVENSERCTKAFTNGDVLFLVKGAI